MDISIVVCTYNRSKVLKQCLEALEKMTMPKGLSWEVLVVDDNSTDDTQEMIENIRKISKLSIRKVFEKQQGVAFARNRGVDEAEGEVIVFIDDDCVADGSCLSSLYEAYLKYNADCVGGKVLPFNWQDKIPKWITSELYSYISIYDKGEEIIEWASSVGTPITSNVLYKKSIFQKVGLFDTSLGRTGKGSVSGGEEQELNNRILKVGGKIIYQPNAVVYHQFRPEFLTKKYMRGLDFNTGMRGGFAFGKYNKRNLLGIPLFIINQFIKSIWAYLDYIAKNGYNNSFRKELYCWYFLGFMWGRVKYRSQSHK